MLDEEAHKAGGKNLYKEQLVKEIAKYNKLWTKCSESAYELSLFQTNELAVLDY